MSRRNDGAASALCWARGELRAVGRASLPYLVFSPLCLGVFIAADDQTVLVTILPDVMHSLKIPAAQIDRAAWLVIAFLVGYSATMPLMGRVADRWGYRRAFNVAILVFIVGSLGVAFTPRFAELSASWSWSGIDGYPWMLLWRVVQSLGAGAVIPISLSAAGLLLAPGRQAIAYGVVGASAEAGGVVGPLWSGAVADWIGWEWIFWLNIPLGIAVMILVAQMPKGVSNPVTVDWLGSILFGLGLTALTLGLFRLAHSDLLMVAWLALSVVLMLMMVVRMRLVHCPDAPSMKSWTNRLLPRLKPEDHGFPKAIFHIRGFIWANVTHLLVGSALMIGLVSVPLMGGTVYGLSALDAGLWLLRMTVALGVAALIGGFVTQTFGTKLPTVIGLGISAVGYWLLSGWTLGISEPTITIHLVCIGAGLGLVIAPIAESALRQVSAEDRGLGAGVVSLSRNVGMTVGLAIIASVGTDQFVVWAPGLEELLNDPDAGARTGLRVFSNFARYASMACILAILPAWIMSGDSQH